MIVFRDSSHVTERYENISKPLNDKRSYRGLTLRNKMKVLLISDPTSQKSAASMSVGVGEFHFQINDYYMW